jgi:Peptidase family M23
VKRLVILLPVILAFQVGAPPALAWTWPVDGPVLRPFAFGDDPYAGGQHRGIDIGAPVGANVRAPAGGSISFAGTVPVGGRVVTIQTPDGYSVTLVHLGTIGATRGASVAEGDIVGTVGPSGEPELAEPYVHLGIRTTADANGYVDPLTLLPPRGTPAPEPAPVAEPQPEPVPAAEEAPPAAEPVGSGADTAPGGAGTRQRTHGRESAPGEARPAHARRPYGTRTADAVHAARTGRAGERAMHPVSSAASSAREGLGPFGPPATMRAQDASSYRSGAHGAFWLWAFVPGALVTAAGAFLLRRQLADAGAADGAPAVLLEGAGAAAEHARGLRLGQEDRLVLDGDLERVLLAEAEPLPDLDRNHDPPELVDVPDNSCRRTARRVCRRSHRLSCVHGLRRCVRAVA